MRDADRYTFEDYVVEYAKTYSSEEYVSRKAIFEVGANALIACMPMTLHDVCLYAYRLDWLRSSLTTVTRHSRSRRASTT